jgi:hypothetical protein
MNKLILFAICLLAAGRTHAQVLLAQYNFDNDVTDAVGNHHGTAFNGPVYTTDRFGNPNGALLLDGSNDYISLANAATLQPSTYTYDVWVKPDLNPPGGQAFCLLSIGGTGGDQMLVNGNSGGIGWSISGYQNPSGTFGTSALAQPVVNQWYHVTAIVGVSSAQIYVNGVLVNGTGIAAGYTPKYAQALAYIGRRTNVGPVGPQFFHGAIDDLKIYSGVNTPLPLNLISFTAKKLQDEAILNWTTANMKNVAAFEIEKSTDAISFIKIGTVNATESNTYNFTDNSKAFLNNYYRLRMVDEDEQFSFSNVLLLKNASPVKLDFFPNPVHDEATILTDANNFNYSMVDLYGREILRGEATDQTATLNCKDLPTGIYFLKITVNGESTIRKFAKN